MLPKLAGHIVRMCDNGTAEEMFVLDRAKRWTDCIEKRFHDISK